MVRVVLLLAALLVPGLVLAQAPAPPASPGERPPMLLIFDASGSMNQRMGNETRLAGAKRVVSDLLAGFPEGTRLGLTLYGHRRARDCSDIENVQPIAPVDRPGLFRMATQIGGLTARGETPIARTLVESIPLFRGQRGGQIVLVTDGREECGGDVCAAARQLAAAGVNLRVDIVGFGTGAAERRALQCVTDITGGRYVEAPDAARLRDALAVVTQPPAPQTQLRVTVTENGRPPVGQPSVRVRGSNFDMTLSDRTVTFTLPAGDYQVTARLGSGQESDAVPVTVTEGRTAELTVGIGTGRMELRILLGQGRVFPGYPNVELRRDGRVIAATSGAQVGFDADPGQYSLRVMMPGGQQSVDIPDLRIVSGQTSRYSVEAGAGELTVNVGGRFRPGAQPFPMVQVLQGGRLVMALTDNPARFVITPGSYEIAVFDAGAEVARRPLTIAAGDSQTMDLAP
jgi:hypothetical protein